MLTKMQIATVALALFFGLATIPLTGAPPATRLIPSALPVPESYFGMHIHGIDVPRPTTKRVTPWPDVPFGSWRLMDAYVRWYDIEPRKNEFNFERLDRYVALAQQKHVKVLLPLFGEPSWASARPSEKENGNPDGSAAEPASMDDWRNFVRAVATRYKGQIEGYEIWNEPNLKMFWTGTTLQMVDLSREAFQVIKSVDPKALVVLPSCTVETGPQYLDDFLKLGGGKYGDALGYHFYVRAKPPEAIADLALHVEDILRTNHVNLPLWNTEAGWADPKPFPSEELAAAYVARSQIVAWAAGVSRFYWYAWDNHSFVTLEMVNRDDVTDKSAAKAYADVQRWLVGAVVRSCESDAAGKWTCELDRGGAKQWIVWNANGAADFAVPPDWHATSQTPLLGAKEKVKGSNMQIGPVPILFEGERETPDRKDRRKDEDR